MTDVLVDVSWGDVSQEEANRLALAAWDGQAQEHVAGSTEPWVSRLVADFAIAIGAKTILETGGYLGDTTEAIVLAMDSLGVSNEGLTVCEIDPDRAEKLRQRFSYLQAPHFVCGDVLDFLRTTRDTFDLAFVDDCHEEAHVRQEIALLYPRMRSGGLIVCHDVVGLCPGNTEELGRIVEKWGGYVIPLPRLGLAGGLGVIVVR